MNIHLENQLEKITILFDVAWSTYKKHFFNLLKINAIPVIISMIVVSIFSYLSDFESISDFVQKEDILHIAGLAFGTFVIAILVSSINYIAQVIEISKTDDLSSNTMSVFQVYKQSALFLHSYLWIMILAVITVFAGFIALIIPGIIFAVWFSFSTFILIKEKKSGVAALKASKAYVKDLWYPIFVRFFVLVLFALFLSMSYGIIKTFIADVVSASIVGESIFDFVYQIIVAPYFIIYGYELYKDVIRVKAKELNIE